MARKGRRSRRSSGKILRKLIVILALGAFVFSAINLLCIYQEYKAGTDEYDQLERFTSRWKGKAIDDAFGEAAIEDRPYETMENPIDFESLKALNEDIIGWIEMEGIDVFYPVMQGENNEYYLYRTFMKTNNIAGALFADFRNDPTFADRNTVIYGHNMKNGEMFGKLKKYLPKPEEAEPEPTEEAATDAPTDEADAPMDAPPEEEKCAYEVSPYFWIYTPDYIYKYEIYSVAIVGERSPDYRREFETDEEYQEFLDRTMGQSLLETGVTVDLEDTVVTLSTCTYADELRLIVQGKRIETYLAVTPEGGYPSQDA